MADLQELDSPTFVLGFSKVMDEVSHLLSEDQCLTLQDRVNYNPMAARLVDLMAEGIQ